MRVDLYTKTVLTVIAGALVYLCVALTPVGTPVHAQNESQVLVAGYVVDGNPVRFESRYERGLPVTTLGGAGTRPAAALPLPGVPAAAPPRALESTAAPTPRATATRVQCQATTKKGSQCSRLAQGGASYCWQHGGGE